MKLPVRLLLTLSTTLLAACGGGGGDAGVAPTVTNFPLLAGYKVLTAAGATNNYTVTGSCSGTATIADSAAVAAAFEGINGYSTTSNATINVPNCTPASNSSTSTSYYDTNYTPLGSSTPGSEYAKVVAAPPSLPASVKVGDGLCQLHDLRRQQQDHRDGLASFQLRRRSRHPEYRHRQRDRQRLRHFEPVDPDPAVTLPHSRRREAHVDQHRRPIQHHQHLAFRADKDLSPCMIIGRRFGPCFNHLERSQQ